MSEHWTEIAQLIESVLRSPDLVTEAVEEVRATSPDLAAIESADVARHTRALLAAATRALAARRGPTEAELSFIEELAVVRAGQGIPIHAVLGAIHVAERRIWAAARSLAEQSGVPLEQVLDARDLYDDWAESVRQRLIVAHRAAESRGTASGHAPPDQLLVRALDGGAAAALAVAEAGLAPGSVSVVVSPDPTGAEANRLILALRSRGALAGGHDGAVVAVVGQLPTIRHVLTDRVAGVAGPGPAEELPALRRLATTTAGIAGHEGRRGLTHVGDVAVRVALDGRSDLSAALWARHGSPLRDLGPRADETVQTVRTWLELGRDTDRTADQLFVHANTVRNRVAALRTATGLDPADPFEAVTLWWLCHTWPSSPN